MKMVALLIKKDSISRWEVIQHLFQKDIVEYASDFAESNGTYAFAFVQLPHRHVAEYYSVSSEHDTIR